jgi:hypothetical protein
MEITLKYVQSKFLEEQIGLFAIDSPAWQPYNDSGAVLIESRLVPRPFAHPQNAVRMSGSTRHTSFYITASLAHALRVSLNFFAG